MKVYVVIHFLIDENDIQQIFKNNDAAEKRAAELNETVNDKSFEQYFVQEWDVEE